MGAVGGVRQDDGGGLVLLAALGRDWRAGFCDSTGLGWRSMLHVFMVFAFRFIVVWGVSPYNLSGSATRFTGRNPRLLLEKADTAFTFIASHTV